MMSEFKSPFEVCPEFEEEHLNILAAEMIKVADETQMSNTGRFDDKYTFETCLFGRLRQLYKQLNLDGGKPWIKLASHGMDYVPVLNSVPLRVFRDDSRSPKKTKIFNRNEIEKSQFVLPLEEHDELNYGGPLVWRLVVEAHPSIANLDYGLEDIENEFRVALAGYHPINNSLVSLWRSDADLSSKILSVDDALIPEKPIMRTEVTLKLVDRKEKKDE